MTLYFHRFSCAIALLTLSLLLATGNLRLQAADDAPAKNAWQAAIDRFEEQDRQSPTAEGGVVFVGSSSIRLWDLAQAFPQLAPLNRGFGGSQVADAAQFAEQLVIKHRPRLVVFYSGDNDLASGKTPEQVRDAFLTFYDKVHTALPKTRILYLSIKPSVARWKLVDKQRRANELVRELLSDRPQLEYLDVGSCLLDAQGQPRAELFVKDGLHLSGEGYHLWNELVGPHLK